MTSSRRLGLALALCTAGVSSVSVYVNAFAVRAFDDATCYTTAKNLVAAVLLTALAVGFAAARGHDERPPRLGGRQWLGLGTVAVVGGSVPFVLFFEGLARATSPQAACPTCS